MRQLAALAFVLAACILIGCGGGGGGGGETFVSNAQYRIVWPDRSRDAIHNPLTSALSATIVFQQAGVGGANVTVRVNRDTLRTAGYTGIYTIPQGISPQRIGSINATFYSLPSQGGVIVGTATSTATLVGTTVEFAPIVLTGTITQVNAIPATIAVGSSATQLQFTALDNAANTVAVTPGSAIWTVTDGSQFVSVTPDGLATAISVGTAHVQATVDGILSPPVPISVIAGDVVVYTWTGAKGGNLTTPTFDAVEGNKFMVVGGTNVVVTQLGYEATSPSQPTNTTAIFDAAGTVLASTTISGTDTLLNGYYYHSITPLTLTSGSTYYIGSLHGTGPAWNYYHDTNVANTPSFISDLGTFFKVTSTIGGGTWQGSAGVRHYVGNFQAHLAP